MIGARFRSDKVPLGQPFGARSAVPGPVDAIRSATRKVRACGGRAAAPPGSGGNATAKSSVAVGSGRRRKARYTASTTVSS